MPDATPDRRREDRHEAPPQGDEPRPDQPGAAVHGTGAHVPAEHGTAEHGTAEHGTAEHGAAVHGPGVRGSRDHDAGAPEGADAARAGPDIVLCPNGPLLVRGDFQLVDATGSPVPANRRTVALCRCGGSAIKPFCDGTHKLNGFDSGDL